jgi:hypothetical protein
VLPEEHRPKIFHVRKPHSSPTFLIDGADERALRAEADRLAQFHA